MIKAFADLFLLLPLFRPPAPKPVNFAVLFALSEYFIPLYNNCFAEKHRAF
jgi:hypothetical protein